MDQSAERLDQAERALRELATRPGGQAQEIAALKAQLQALEQAAAREKTQLGEELKALGQARQADGAKSAKELDELKSRFKSAEVEIARLTAENKAIAQEAGKTAGELAALRAQTGPTQEDYQRLCLAGEAAGAGWRARQLAARQNKLIGRCGQLRASAKGDSLAVLLDRLEVLLTRLDMLDASDAAAMRTFAALVDSSGAGGQMDSALSTGQHDPAVRQWLLETRFILAGGQRAA